MTAIGDCWSRTTKLQVSYNNLMEWIYTICEKIGGTANIRLHKISGEQYEMVLDLSEGSDRSIIQEENPHIIFSDGYTNLLSFTYARYAKMSFLPMCPQIVNIAPVNAMENLSRRYHCAERKISQYYDV